MKSKDDLENQLNDDLIEDKKEEYADLLEYFITEKENENFLEKSTRFLIKVALFLEKIILSIYSMFNFVFKHMFLISLIITLIIIVLAVVLQKLKLI